MLDFVLLRVAAAVIGTTLAAWQDARTSFIDDRLTTGMIFLGLVLNSIGFFLGEPFQEFVLTFAFIGVLGFVLYKTGQFGGGDVLLLLGLYALLPENPFHYSFAVPLVASIFLYASVLAVPGSFLLYFYKLKLYSLKTLKSLEYREKLLLSLSVLGSLVTGLALSASFGLFLGFAAALFFLSGFLLTVLWKKIMSDVIIKDLTIEQIEDEDIMAIDKLPSSLVKTYGLERVLTKNQVEKLKEIRRKEKRKTFPIHTNLPRFGPYLLAGLIAALVFGGVEQFFVLFL
ncbi:prepilin peptidase [Candidatus Micrarchaeota archaeon]|nr:prepilin peptidase [Candidatus Micrarchaeota archaeon]